MKKMKYDKMSNRWYCDKMAINEIIDDLWDGGWKKRIDLMNGGCVII